MITTPVSDYAAAVRAALTDVPEPDRSELLEDLEDHLAEVAGESDEPLEARLGTPESYAAELHAAYLQRPDQRPVSKKKPRLLHRFDTRVAAFHTRMAERLPWYETARNDFRPAWWLFRGYLVAVAFWIFTTGDVFPFPTGILEFLILIIAVGASVALGYRMRAGRRRSSLPAFVALGIGLLAVFTFFGLMVQSSDDHGPQPFDSATPGFPGVPDLANIYPYTKDGTPLKDVLLYDQNGRPIQLDPDWYGYESITGAAPQIPNSYPLPICDPNDHYMDEPETPLIPFCPASNAGDSGATSPQLPSATQPPSAPPTEPTPNEPTASAESSPSSSPSASPTKPESSPTE